MTASGFGLAMRRAGLRQGDVVALTGRDRTTVWRWCSDRSKAPQYAWTIVRQQKTIKELATRLVEADEKARSDDAFISLLKPGG